MNPGRSAAPARRAVTALAVATYLIMVVVNYGADALPLNGIRTGQVADSYPNLFAPAGLTFAIWGVIYLLLAGHVLYQCGLFHESGDRADRSTLLNTVGVYFAISSLANTGWVFAWHYRVIGLSVVLIVVILFCLIAISRAVSAAELTPRERLLVGIPFSVYFGWITVAAVANVTVLLVSLNWDGFGLPDSTWAVMVIAAAMAIGTATMLRNRDIAYGLTLAWAYLGILLKHLSSDGFAGHYPAVIATVIGSLAVCGGGTAVIALHRVRQRREAVRV
jgi:hypothetical protein